MIFFFLYVAAKACSVVAYVYCVVDAMKSGLPPLLTSYSSEAHATLPTISACLSFYGDRRFWSFVVGCIAVTHYLMQEENANRLLQQMGGVAEHLLDGFENAAHDLPTYSLFAHAALVALPTFDAEEYGTRHGILVLLHIALTLMCMRRASWIIETLQPNSRKAKWVNALNNGYLTIAILLAMLGVGKETVNTGICASASPSSHCRPILELLHGYFVEKELILTALELLFNTSVYIIIRNL